MKSLHLALFVLVITQTFTHNSLACSMCKVTINGRTYLGNNEDSWRLGAKISFVNATKGKFGFLYVSYDDFFPQGAMNEAGLSFDGLTIYKKNIKVDSSKTVVKDFGAFTKEIMQNCATVEEVRRYAMQFSRHRMKNGMLLFADRTGAYLVMEPDSMILGHDDKYVIANFCPSVTPEKERLDWGRYRRGREFIQKHQADTSANYCLALVDTMHECRPKMGEGTMYSSVADLQNSIFQLYFYHDYSKKVTFNLKQELAKGNHTLDIAPLFPPNSEYQRLANYKVPHNDRRMLFFLIAAGGICSFSAMYFLVSYLSRVIRRKPDPFAGYQLLLFLLSAAFAGYLVLLFRNPTVFYSEAPYRDFQFSAIDVASYLPYLLLILIIPLLKVNLALFTKKYWRLPSRLLFTLNNIIYLTLLFLFSYWGFYNVF